jgi:hypothetical protein
MALAHAVGDRVEAAYRRGDLMDKRRQLGQAWADFCGRDAEDRTASIVDSNQRLGDYAFG